MKWSSFAGRSRFSKPDILRRSAAVEIRLPSLPATDILVGGTPAIVPPPEQPGAFPATIASARLGDRPRS